MGESPPPFIGYPEIEEKGRISHLIQSKNLTRLRFIDSFYPSQKLFGFSKHSSTDMIDVG